MTVLDLCRYSLPAFSSHMFWLRNKKINFQLLSLTLLMNLKDPMRTDIHNYKGNYAVHRGID